MKKTITLTIDVEHDCPPYLGTYRGIETGLPRLCSILEKYDIKATFFVTGDVASKYPREIKEITVDHEIGCHGYSHKRFDRMSFKEASKEIEKSSEVLHRLAGHGELSSFRAPNLKFPERFLGLLKDNGYSIDSSLARYKIEYFMAGKKNQDSGLLRIPVSATSSLLRLPFGNEMIRRLPQPIVLFFHPWEFVEMTGLWRWDCRINTGLKALWNLEELIAVFKRNGFHFCTISDFLKC